MRTMSYDAIDFAVPSAIVVGAEGSGLRRLVREKCDFTARIPDAGTCVEPERISGNRHLFCSKRSVSVVGGGVKRGQTA